MFFALSGLVVTLSIFREMTVNEKSFRQTFLVKRIARLLPLHYLTMGTMMVFVLPDLLVQHGFFLNLLTHLLFIHNMFQGYHGSINGSNWSVGTELQFYLVVCLFAPIIRRARSTSLACISLFISWSWRWFSFMYVRKSDQVQNLTFSTFWLSTQLPGMLDSFMFGILLAKHIWCASKELPIGTERQRVDNLKWHVLVTMLVCTTTWSLFWLHSAYWDSVVMVTFWRTCLALSCVLLLKIAIALDERTKNIRLFACFKYIGDISYGIYLWHLPVIVSLKRLQWQSPSTATSVASILTVIIASFSWHLFEKPMNRSFIHMYKELPFRAS